MGDSAIIVICRLPATVDELVDGSELLKDGRGVDDGHQVAQARHVAQLHPCVFIGIREGLGHWQRLRDSRRLDEHVIKAALSCERRERCEQIFTEGAADATVRELHHLLDHCGASASGRAYELCIHIDRRHVIHDDGDPTALLVIEQVCEQRGLARSKKARQDAHWHRSVRVFLIPVFLLNVFLLPVFLLLPLVCERDRSLLGPQFARRLLIGCSEALDSCLNAHLNLLRRLRAITGCDEPITGCDELNHLADELRCTIGLASRERNGMRLKGKRFSLLQQRQDLIRTMHQRDASFKAWVRNRNRLLRLAHKGPREIEGGEGCVHGAGTMDLAAQLTRT